MEVEIDGDEYVRKVILDITEDALTEVIERQLNEEMLERVRTHPITTLPTHE